MTVSPNISPPPVGKAEVRGQDHAPLPVVGIDQLEEQACTTLGNRKEADLVDNQERGIDMGPHLGLHSPTRSAWIRLSIKSARVIR